MTNGYPWGQKQKCAVLARRGRVKRAAGARPRAHSRRAQFPPASRRPDAFSLFLWLPGGGRRRKTRFSKGINWGTRVFTPLGVKEARWSKHYRKKVDGSKWARSIICQWYSQSNLNGWGTGSTRCDVHIIFHCLHYFGYLAFHVRTAVPPSCQSRVRFIWIPF